jgi:tetracycline repressor-like protein
VALRPTPGAVRGLRHRHHQPRPFGPASASRLRRQYHDRRPPPWLRPAAIGPLLACHVIQRERPQPIPGMPTPASVRLRAAAGRSRRPSGRTDDGISRHPQDPDRPLQGLVAASPRSCCAGRTSWRASWLAKKLVTRAARRLPPGHQERYQEEWTAEIEAMGGGAGIGPLVFALLWYAKSRQMAEITSQAPIAAPDRALIHQFPAFGEGLVGKATALFSEYGVNVGIHRVISEAGVAPMTVYRRFGGKDDLVAASLTLWSARWLEALAEQVER